MFWFDFIRESTLTLVTTYIHIEKNPIIMSFVRMEVIMVVSILKSDTKDFRLIAVGYNTILHSA